MPNEKKNLDVKKTKESNQFVISVFKKPAFTGLSRNFSSFTPFVYKVNLIKTLLFKGFKIFFRFKFYSKFSKILSEILWHNELYC